MIAFLAMFVGFAVGFVAGALAGGAAVYLVCGRRAEPDDGLDHELAEWPQLEERR